MPDTVRCRATHRQVVDLVRGVVASVAGRGAASVATSGLRLRVGMVALSCIQEAFVVKAAGGTGEDGIQWAPLLRATVAARRIGPGDAAGLKSIGISRGKFGYGARKQSGADLDAKGRLKRGFLTAAQDKRWRLIFATRKMQMMARHGMSEAAAGARAGAIAWATLKAEGAKTKLDVLGGRRVLVGRDSGRLFNSLSSGTVDADNHDILSMPEANPDRILRVEPNAVVVGSNVEYASSFHAKRPLWPAGELPAAWSQRMTEALASGIAETVGREAAAA